MVLDTESATRAYLLYVVMPLWLAVGAADWLCHRRTRIEATSGWKESTLHLMMLGEVGLPIVLALFFEINALVIAIMIAAFVAHEITAHLDLWYAIPRRPVGALEQHVHNYLGTLPFMALSFILVLHWPQLFALVGAGPQAARLEIRLKQTPLPTAYVVTLLAATALFALLPYAEEWWRGWRHLHRRARAADAGRAGQGPSSYPRRA